MSEADDHKKDLPRRIDEAIVKRLRRLRFHDALERRYQSDNLPTNAQYARYAGWTAVLAYNLMLAIEFGAGDFPAEAIPVVLLAAHGLVTAPCLTFIFLARRVRTPKRLDACMCAAYVLVTLASIILNLHMSSRAATNDAFIAVLIPVTCNIALPISFAMAALGSAFSVTALIALSLGHPGFSAESQSAMILLYLVAAIVTLAANYRHEWVSRANHLNYVRETLRSASIARANETLSAISRTDFLTGLPNRRDFDERCDAALARCLRDRTSVTVLLADIDNFKLYNDYHGHIQGDACLRSVARAIAAAVEGTGGVAGRFGGEEFAVVLPGLTADAAAALADRIRAAVLALRAPHEGLGDRRFITVSIGAASLNPEFPETSSELLSRADAALYRAKRGGRDRSEVDVPRDARAYDGFDRPPSEAAVRVLSA
jgi:diguanylate cyclase (GGDEF)-like protein